MFPSGLSADTQISSFLLLRDENAKIHRTEVYRTSQVVLRRGFDFLAQFQLSDEFNPDEHSLEVHFRRGPRPAYSRETHFVSRIGRKPTRSYQWPGSTLTTNKDVVKVAVKTPVDVPVGEYEVEAEVCRDGASSKFVCQETVVFLFNPWHEGVCVHACICVYVALSCSIAYVARPFHFNSLCQYQTTHLHNLEAVVVAQVTLWYFTHMYDTLSMSYI